MTFVSEAKRGRSKQHYVVFQRPLRTAQSRGDCSLLLQSQNDTDTCFVQRYLDTALPVKEVCLCAGADWLNPSVS